MARSKTAVPAAALILGATVLAGLPASAQKPPLPPVSGAKLKLDFGAGRSVSIDCGETAIEACIAAAAPLIEKVADSDPVATARPAGHGKFAKGMRGAGHGAKDRAEARGSFGKDRPAADRPAKERPGRERPEGAATAPGTEAPADATPETPIETPVE
ncbi:hypothetical protein [Pseudogemmobacter sonorensis]|uniref:hypothetical protein n=1 Tax=Pseudogemmobacter sonorensis TaxID=2989681 RepID=UPI0036816EF5